MNTYTRSVTAVVVVAVVLAGVTPFALVGTVTAATYTVDDSGGADFTTIQAAVDAASAGDRIEVAPGTYDEAVDIDKPLTIVGAPGDGTVGAGPDAPVLDGTSPTAFRVRPDADGTTIEGFVVDGGYTHALFATLGDGDTLSDVTFRENDVVGAQIDFTLNDGDVTLDGIEISANRLTDASKIDVNGDAPSTATVTDFAILGNEITTSQGDAIDVDLETGGIDATLTVQGNTITDASVDAIEFEFDQSSTYDVTIQSNIVHGSGGDAIEFLDNAGSGMTGLVADNDLRNNGGAAVWISADGDASQITITRNDIVGNGAGVDSGETDAESVVDARNNYWGASDGPSSANGSLVDPVDGTPADGSGDSVSGPLSSNESLSNVRFASFATNPVSVASESTPGDGSATSVGGSATFDVGDATVSSSNPVVGEEVTISVPVTNEGERAGTFRGMFRSDFTGHEVIEFRLAPGETETATTTVVYSDAKSYNVYLDDEYTGSLAVASRDPMQVSVDADPANGTVNATVENPRRTAIDIPLPGESATDDSGVVLTSMQVTPDSIDDFTLRVTQTGVNTTNVTDSTNATNATNVTSASTATPMLLPDGTAPVSAFTFDASLQNDEVESVTLTYRVNVTRYPTLADAAVGDELSMYRYDAESDSYTRTTAEVVETTDESLTVSVTLDGFSTYLVGVDRAAFDVSTSVTGNPVAAGDSLSLVFDVTNTGDGAGRYAPAVSIAGEPVEAGQLTLAAGESGTLVVEVPTSTPGIWPISMDDRLVAIAFVELADDEN